jgi:hypothetical protein
MAAYLVFTVDRGNVVPGARVEKFVLRGAGVEVPALLLGEEGRGRKLFSIPVVGAEPGDTIVAADGPSAQGEVQRPLPLVAANRPSP